MNFKKALIASTILATALFQGHAFAAQSKGSMTAIDEVQWQPLGESPIKIFVMWGDRDEGANGTYLKLPAGLETGKHAHTHDYNGITLQGVWEHEMDGKWKTLPAGSHVFQPGKEFHNDRCVGPQACVLLIQQDDKGDLLLPK
ncbi:MAG: DUF4437 domain-containing protein [Oceanospirillaceae bacterium]